MLVREGASSTKAAPTTTSTSTQVWFRNPRIVRVSHGFKGKDRHSKVTTVRGLKDRRIRLSVLTAIQLYDLQDKLGLTQPSKVVDWLLNAAQHEIDKLPPLQMPPAGSFIQFPQMDQMQLTAPSRFFDDNNVVSEDLVAMSNGDVVDRMGIKPRGNDHINILRGSGTDQNRINETYYTPYHQWGSSSDHAWMSQSGSHSSSQEDSARVSEQAHNYFHIANLQLSSQNLFDHVNLNSLQETMKNK